MFGAKKKRATGIHFAGRRLRIVELARTRSGVALCGAVDLELVRPFAADSLDEGDEREDLVTALQQVRAGGEIDFARPCCAVDSRFCLLKGRSVVDPESASRHVLKENEEHLLWEAQQFLGDGHADFSIDAVQVGDHGFIVAVRRQALSGYLALCAQAGLDEPDVDIEPFSLFNAAEQAGLLEADGAEMILHIGAERIEGLLIEEGILEGVAHCVRKDRGRDEEEAQRLVDMAADCFERTSEEGEARGSVERVLLAGTADDELREALEERLEAECELFASFAGMECLLEEGLPENEAAFAVAAGLAHRRLSE